MWSEGLCRFYQVHKNKWRTSAKMAMNIPIASEVGNIRMTQVLFFIIIIIIIIMFMKV
jgi:hypothetical protein